MGGFRALLGRPPMLLSGPLLARTELQGSRCSVASPRRSAYLCVLVELPIVFLCALGYPFASARFPPPQQAGWVYRL